MDIFMKSLDAANNVVSELIRSSTDTCKKKNISDAEFQTQNRKLNEYVDTMKRQIEKDKLNGKLEKKELEKRQKLLDEIKQKQEGCRRHNTESERSALLQNSKTTTTSGTYESNNSGSKNSNKDGFGTEDAKGLERLLQLQRKAFMNQESMLVNLSEDVSHVKNLAKYTRVEVTAQNRQIDNLLTTTEKVSEGVNIANTQVANTPSTEFGMKHFCLLLWPLVLLVILIALVLRKVI